MHSVSFGRPLGLNRDPLREEERGDAVAESSPEGGRALDVVGLEGVVENGTWH